MKSSVDTVADSVTTPESAPLLELDAVSIQLGGRTILRDVTARIEKGELVGVIGPNGTGKSTLLRVLLGLVHPVAGSVRFAGRPARRGNSLVGYSPQNRAFDRDLPLTARDFVEMGIDGTRWGLRLPGRGQRERVDAILEAVGALSFADVSLGLLSGGEQQRLSIAQALVSRPSLLLLDEPLASLDLRSQREIVALVDRLRRETNVAVLFVTHGVNPLLGVMDRVWYLAGGNATIGTVDEVIRSEVLSRLYGAPVEVIEAHGHIFVSAGDGSEEHHSHDTGL
jgi:zinc/manganese transport system ATP-binding protein